ncbi:MAG: sulfotransferase [Candidatus Aenigmatarchaeota archaeon]
MAIEKIIFISGVARSGTSELVNVLNEHSCFLIGSERYYYVIERRELDAYHFEMERFLNILPEDCHDDSQLFKEGQFLIKKGVLTGKINVEEIKVIGDKYPNLYEHFDWIFERFPNAMHIYIVRNPFSVAQSFQRRFENVNDNWNENFISAIKRWNESIEKVLFFEEKHKENFIFVVYEKFFSNVEIMNKLFTILGYHPIAHEKLQSYVDKFYKLNSQMTPKDEVIRYYVSQNANWEAYKHICKISDHQFNKETG